MSQQKRARNFILFLNFLNLNSVFKKLCNDKQIYHNYTNFTFFNIFLPIILTFFRKLGPQTQRKHHRRSEQAAIVGTVNHTTAT